MRGRGNLFPHLPLPSSWHCKKPCTVWTAAVRRPGQGNGDPNPALPCSALHPTPRLKWHPGSLFPFPSSPLFYPSCCWQSQAYGGLGLGRGATLAVSWEACGTTPACWCRPVQATSVPSPPGKLQVCSLPHCSKALSMILKSSIMLLSKAWYLEHLCLRLFECLDLTLILSNITNNGKYYRYLNS